VNEETRGVTTLMVAAFVETFAEGIVGNASSLLETVHATANADIHVTIVDFVVYAPNLATGVWVGFDGVRTLGRLESGAHAALPIWTKFMDQALRNSPVMTFAIPEGIQFAQIDTSTGDLPSKTSRHIGTEVFRKGTEPGKAAPQKANPMDFFEFDRLNSESSNQLSPF